MVVTFILINKNSEVRPFFEFNSCIVIILNVESVDKNQVGGCNVETVCTFTHGINNNNSDGGEDEDKIVEGSSSRPAYTL